MINAPRCVCCGDVVIELYGLPNDDRAWSVYPWLYKAASALSIITNVLFIFFFSLSLHAIIRNKNRAKYHRLRNCIKSAPFPIIRCIILIARNFWFASQGALINISLLCSSERVACGQPLDMASKDLSFTSLHPTPPLNNVFRYS